MVAAGGRSRLVRPLILGRVPEKPLFDLALLLAYCVVGFWVAFIVTRRRLLN